MDVREVLRGIIADSITDAFGDKVAAGDALAISLVETPREPAHGDLATSACLKLARTLRAKPIEIAGTLAERIRAAAEEKAPGLLEKVEAAAPGFVNFRLALPFFRELLRDISRGGYGRSDMGAGTRINVEFVSSNPTGPLTVAHGRQAAVGDALANILAYAGFDVTREYYVNDTGQQIRMLGASVYHYYAAAAGGTFPFPEDGYKGEYIVDVARRLFEEEGAALLALPEGQAVRKAGTFAAEMIMEGIRRDLEQFGVRFDVWFSQDQFETSGTVDRLMERMRSANLVYDHEGAVWMKVGGLGDQKDRVVVKSDGTYTYRTPDIAYHENKFARGFDRLVDILGPDHHGHIITMQAAMRALGHPVEAFRGLIVQFCSLWRGKEKLKMSTRAGQFVTLREVFEEVGIDAARYFFTARKTDSPLDFDLELAKQRSMENPVYYIQYMSARLSGVIETAAADERFAGGMKDGLFLPDGVDLAALGAEEEGLLRCLLGVPAVIEKAAGELEPHRLCYYLVELAGLFHNYYTRCRFVSEDAAASRARLYMASALKVLVRDLLALIGVGAPEKM